MHKIQARGDAKHCQMKFHTFQSTYPNVIHNHTNETKITNIATIMNTHQNTSIYNLHRNITYLLHPKNIVNA